MTNPFQAVEKVIEERFNSIFWKVILKHLTPETIMFIKNDYKEAITKQSEALKERVREWAKTNRRRFGGAQLSLYDDLLALLDTIE